MTIWAQRFVGYFLFLGCHHRREGLFRDVDGIGLLH